jgi:hypothetical protein
MRRKTFAVVAVLLVAVLLLGCTHEAFNNRSVAFFGPEPAATATPAPATTPAPVLTNTPSTDWTVMFYLNGSNLESENGEATRNLQSLLSVTLPENIRVLVYTGGTARWQNDSISARNNQIWLVQNGELTLLESMDPQSMGASNTLASFIAYGQAFAPYERKALILWDHGAGSVVGFGSDELFNEDGLYLYELADAMAQGYDGTPFDLVGFDACLMASVETASVFAPYAKTLVASEEVEPGGGWDYRTFFSQLAADADMTGEELGIAITDSYYNKYAQTPTEGYITCSVIDLAKVPGLETLLGDFSKGLSGGIVQPAVMQTLADARQGAESYGEEPGMVSFDMIDLYNFVELQSSANAETSAALKAAIEDAVVYEVSGSQRQYSYGLSIYFPFAAKDYFDYCLDIYDDLDFCPEYQSFIADFAACLVDPDYIAEVPEYEETAVFEVPEIGQSEDFSEVGSYYVELTDEQIEYLGYVYCTLGWYLEDGTLIDLGDDSDLTREETSNGVIIRDDFAGSWTGLNGQPVMLYILEETDNYLIYNVPIEYNGQKAVIKAAWVWDESYDENGYYVINGIFLTSDEYSAPDTRMEVTLQPGDVIEPLYPTLDSPDDYSGYYVGDPITVGEEGLSLDLVWLPAGTYQYGFKFSPEYGNPLGIKTPPKA